MNDAPSAARCLNCGAAFEPQDISPKRRFAECSHCGTLHNVSSFYARRQQPDLHVSRLPASIQYGEGPKGATLRIQTDQALPANYFTVILLIATSMHLLFSIGAVFARSSKQESHFWIALLLGLFVWPAWYVVLTTYVNHIRITIDRFCILVGSRPLPAMRTRRFETGHARGWLAMPLPSSPNDTRYRIILVNSSNQGFPVLPRSVNRQEAQALLQLLDRGLKRCQSVRTELSRETRATSHLRARRLTRRHVEDVSNLDMGRLQRFSGNAESSELACEGCGAPIPLRAINRQGLYATCCYCGMLSDLREFLKVSELPPSRKVEYLPAGANLKVQPNRVELDASKAPVLDRIPNLASAAALIIPALFMALLVMLAGIAYTSGWKQLLLIAGAVALAGGAISFALLWNRSNPRRTTSLTRKFLVHRVGLGGRDLSYSLPTATILEFAALEHAGAAGAEPGYMVVAIDSGRCRHVIADQLSSPLYALIIRDAFQDFLERGRESRST